MQGKPEYESQEYDSSDGIVPRFRGTSTEKSVYVPQPNLNKLPNYKPQSESKVFLLESHLTEVEPYSHSIHCPMPVELTQQTAPTKSLWIKDNLKPLTRESRYDLTSSYQEDYCGKQTEVRRISQ